MEILLEQLNIKTATASENLSNPFHDIPQQSIPAATPTPQTDPVEQEIVQGSYHSHEQMMRWHQKFSGVSELTKRLDLMEEELIQRPIRVAIPYVARGYEAIYERFLNGKLIYEGKIELRIADLANPLKGTFDLSKCGLANPLKGPYGVSSNAGEYLSIYTGYRKGKKPENYNKLEIWFAPHFLIEKNLAGSASHFKPIMDSWDPLTAPVGTFFTQGGWDKLDWYEYATKLTWESYNDVGNNIHNISSQSVRPSTHGHAASFSDFYVPQFHNRHPSPLMIMRTCFNMSFLN